MKKFYLASILPILLGSCLGYKELPVEYDYSYKGNFKKYRTFDIMKPAGPADSTMTNEVIEKINCRPDEVSGIQTKLEQAPPDRRV